MAIQEIKSMVAEIPRFLETKCLQFGFEIGGKTKRFVVGEDIRRFGIENWERPINAHPSDPIWQALFLAPMVVNKRSNYDVCVSYPLSLKDQYQDIISGRIKIILPDDAGSEKSHFITINEVVTVPEAYAHATAFREVLKRDCVVISVGFGTIEIGMVDRTAKVVETRMASITHGLHKVASPFRSELRKLGYDDTKTRHQNQDHNFDDILSRTIDESLGKEGIEPINLIIRGGSLKASDLIGSANNVLDRYSNELSRHICDYVERQAFTSSIDFVLTGGGVHYPIVVDAVRDAIEKYGYQNLTVASNFASKNSAAIGISIIANKIFSDSPSPIGVDVGNNSVIVDYEPVSHEENTIDINPSRAMINHDSTVAVDARH